MRSDIFKKIDDYRFMIPRSFDKEMLADVMIYASEEMLGLIVSEGAHLQAVNVACLPGIEGNSLAMPDIHLGYGFPIGGVAAFDPENGGIISPGGVGYDINCGVRVIRTDLEKEQVLPKLKEIVSAFAVSVPAGLDSGGKYTLSTKELDNILAEGAGWAVKNGYGTGDDIDHTEEGGCFKNADPSLVSSHAKKRGITQQGSLGSGNHFLEIQAIDEIYDEKQASEWGLFQGQVTIMVHCGSRGLGHQVCSDNIKTMKKAALKYGIKLKDGELACAPVSSPEGKDYYAAMAAAANFAWANRQMITHSVREAFARVINASPAKLGLTLLYDVAHNIAKMERHKGKNLCVHRKGATRAFPGQPVLVPGDMGRYSYVLLGSENAMNETWGSVCHGAGRALSRHAAMKSIDPGKLRKWLDEQGIVVMAATRKGLVEEAPEAYKDVREVVNVIHGAGLASKVARMRPLGVVKG